MFWSDHLLEPNLDGLQGPPDSPAPATTHTDSTCPWCHSEVTLLDVPSSARDLPWLHIIHRLLLCPAGLGRPPLFKFCSEMLLLTSDWPHYRCHLGILLADLNIPPSASASSCTPSTTLFTDFFCLLADPLRLEDPPSGFPVAEQTRRWLAMLAVTACFLPTMCPALFRDHFQTSCTYLSQPLQYRHRYYLRQSGWSSCVSHFCPPGLPGYVPPAAS
jgi:hypothetical protein